MLLSLDLVRPIAANRGVSKKKNRMANSLDPDEMACYKSGCLRAKSELFKSSRAGQFS